MLSAAVAHTPILPIHPPSTQSNALPNVASSAILPSIEEIPAAFIHWTTDPPEMAQHLQLVMNPDNSYSLITNDNIPLTTISAQYNLHRDRRIHIFSDNRIRPLGVGTEDDARMTSRSSDRSFGKIVMLSCCVLSICSIFVVPIALFASGTIQF